MLDLFDAFKVATLTQGGLPFVDCAGFRRRCFNWEEAAPMIEFNWAQESAWYTSYKPDATATCYGYHILKLLLCLNYDSS